MTSCALLGQKTAKVEDQSDEIVFAKILGEEIPDELMSYEPGLAKTKRAPASAKMITPVPLTGDIIYTPLWIKIPVSECVQRVKNHHYPNGACIERRQ